MTQLGLHKIRHALNKEQFRDSKAAVAQLTWLVLLKLIDAEELATGHTIIPSSKFKWRSWASLQKTDEASRLHPVKYGVNLIAFVNHELFPYLTALDSPVTFFTDTKLGVGNVFSLLSNQIKSGQHLRDLVKVIDGIDLVNEQHRHAFIHFYSSQIREMFSDGKHCTSDAIIKTIYSVLNPTGHERVFDCASGSSALLIDLSAKLKDGQNHLGIESNGLVYAIGVLNMLLHRMNPDMLKFGNTVETYDSDLHGLFDIVVGDLPHCRKRHTKVANPTTLNSNEVSYQLLFVAMNALKSGGKAAITIKDSFFNDQSDAALKLKRLLQSEFNLHRVFTTNGIPLQRNSQPSSILFFNKEPSTGLTWLYTFRSYREFGKPVNFRFENMLDFLALEKGMSNSKRSRMLATSALLSISSQPSLFVREKLKRKSTQFILPVSDYLNITFDCRLAFS